MATRKTHVVRIKHPTNEDIWVDIEVLDAVGFRTDNGKEMVLSVDAKKAKVNIKDDTGDGNARPGGAHATRRSHMKRITGSSDATQLLDFEILDGVAFRDQNNDEWVLSHEDKGSLNVYNTTTHTGSAKSTRRVHNEKVYSDPKDKSSPSMLVERCDTMVFRGPNNKELVIKMPSYDDGNGARASTAMTPRDYDPAKNSTPPDNTDPGVYAFIPKSSNGCATGTTAVKCGPLWWPRAINKKGGPWYWYVPTQTAMQYSIIFHPGKFKFNKNPSVSSWGGRVGYWELVYAPGVYFEDLTGEHVFFIPFQSFGFGSLEEAIEGGGFGNDWGLIDFSDTRIDANEEDGLNKDPCIVGERGSPDIWQLTGIAAPALIKPVPPAKKWLPGSISTKLAKQVAEAWLSDWASTTSSFNGGKAGDCGDYTIKYVYIHWPAPVDDGATQRFIEGLEDKRMAYPGTSFSVPLWDMRGSTPLTGGRYIGGIPPDFWSNTQNTQTGAPDSVIELLGQGHYASQLSGGQLDPTKWDTSDPPNPKRKAVSSA